MKNELLYIEHILISIIKIEQYTISGQNEFMNLPIIQDAVIRNLEIIGEATKKITGGFRQKNPQIPWKQMAAMRDVLIHDYMGVDLNLLWNVVAVDLPPLKDALRQMIRQNNSK